MSNVNGIPEVSLEGRRVRLRPPHPEDFTPSSVLYTLRTDTRNLYLWSRRRTLPSPNAFREEWERDESVRLVIENSKGEVLGFVFAYDFMDKHCSIGVVIRPDRRTMGYGVEAMALFLRYLFAYYSLVKVYAVVYEFNKLSLSTVKKAGFRLEGTFSKHVEWNGRWWVAYQFAFYREDLPRLERFLARLNHHEAKNAGNVHAPAMVNAE